MNKRGKFNSLILINWNGFFAKKFDLDSFVTTLSGGNGAGKSTTMAAFVAALIPDLSLLNFRNTTEAGATTGSRDKGLYGKLKPGNCYAALDCENSLGQRIIVGIRLQQIQGRDKKLDIKPFSIHNLAHDVDSMSIFTEIVPKDGKDLLHINSLQTVKAELDKLDNVELKQYNSTKDYHSVMFDAGLLPRKLLTGSDRTKYFKIIEASLYGGISSAITGDLKNYLLPENSDVSKAFLNMESALNENRRTLALINETEKDRAFFKKLIECSVDYVASDYMRNHNRRKDEILKLLDIRKNLYTTNAKYVVVSDKLNSFNEIINSYNEEGSELENEIASLQDKLQILKNVLVNQNIINQTKEECDTLEEIKFEREERYNAIKEEELILDEEFNEINKQYENVRDELVNQQKYLNNEQERKIQYKQAYTKLNEVNETLSTNLTIADIADKLSEFKTLEKDKSTQVIQQRMQLNIQEKSKLDFENALNYVEKLCPGTSKSNAYEVAQALLKSRSTHQTLANSKDEIQRLLLRQEEQFNKSQEKLKNNLKLQTQLGTKFSSLDEIEESLETKITLQADLTENLEAILDEREDKQRQLNILEVDIKKLQESVVPYHNAAQDYERIQSKLVVEVNSLADLRNYTSDLQKTLVSENIDLMNLNQKIEAHKDSIDVLNNKSINSNNDLNYIAELLDGILLSSIYEDVNLEDASYFSALYGPARDAIIVKSLEDVKEKLSTLPNLPQDLYLIEGNYNDFDENIFSSIPYDKGVLVQIQDDQWRFSSFVENTTFSAVAREKQLNTLTEELKLLEDEATTLNYAIESKNVLLNQINHYLTNYSEYAFTEDPEELLRNHNQELNTLRRECDNLKNQENTLKSKVAACINEVQVLTRLASSFVETDYNTEEELTDLREKLENAVHSSNYLKEHGKTLEELEKVYGILRDIGEEEFDANKYESLEHELNHITKAIYLLQDVLDRKEHFTYYEGEIEDINFEEGEAVLRSRLEKLTQSRDTLADRIKNNKVIVEREYKSLLEVQSSLKTKLEHLEKIKANIDENIIVDESVIISNENRLASLKDNLDKVRQKITSETSDNAVNLRERTELENRLGSYLRGYKQQRIEVLASKKKFSKVNVIVKENNLYSKLYKRDLLNSSENELRYQIDKSLDTLRELLKGNEYLRDSLRKSEDNNLETKIYLFIDVYKHLRERIRQDIIKTDDPIEAIEQMEIELNKLATQLRDREKSLHITVSSVSQTLDTIIRREQNRVTDLNKGLSNIAFGQISSVRLDMDIKATHLQLLYELRTASTIYPDLFNNENYTFNQALGTMYKRLNPQLELSRYTTEDLGKRLLDYRNYLDLTVEICRGTDGWLKAESGNLSTGEAIGTGMSILLMVIQSWENESKRYLLKNMLPCRLLFLDEAARLDHKSIATLFELCDRLDMQLLIAAPDNISPEKGTTYKLVRKIIDNKETVHVVGIRGFKGISDAA